MCRIYKYDGSLVYTLCEFSPLMVLVAILCPHHYTSTSKTAFLMSRLRKTALDSCCVGYCPLFILCPILNIHFRVSYLLHNLTNFFEYFDDTSQ